ncbi:hypothetical protein [Pseudomonas sp. AP42]|jgi:hypothetical protein|nr:hypothetical protein [Pseudomonas sp. AP42]
MVPSSSGEFFGRSEMNWIIESEKYTNASLKPTRCSINLTD